MRQPSLTEVYSKLAFQITFSAITSYQKPRMPNITRPQDLVIGRFLTRFSTAKYCLILEIKTSKESSMLSLWIYSIYICLEKVYLWEILRFPNEVLALQREVCKEWIIRRELCLQRSPILAHAHTPQGMT